MLVTFKYIIILYCAEVVVQTTSLCISRPLLIVNGMLLFIFCEKYVKLTDTR